MFQRIAISSMGIALLALFIGIVLDALAVALAIVVFFVVMVAWAWLALDTSTREQMRQAVKADPPETKHRPYNGL